MTQRIRFLDVLRGVALCGILPVNLPYFAYAVALVEKPPPDLPPIDVIGHHLIEGFFTLKFVTMFSFLFGIGIVLLRGKCERDGYSVNRVFIQRYGALLGFGFAHVVFLWFGDILIFYAGLGLLTFWFAHASPKVLAWVGGTVMCAPLLVVTIVLASPTAQEFFAQSDAAWQQLDAEEQARAATGTWEDFGGAIAQFHPEFESTVYRDASYGRQVLVRMVTWIFYAIFGGLLFLIPRAGGMFLLGIAAARSGWVLDPVGRRSAFRRAAIIGLGLGIPLQALVLLVGQRDPSVARDMTKMLFLYTGSLGMSFGYVGLVGLLCARSEIPRFLRAFEAVGRTAFTNYIGQSLIAAAIFYGWGLGKHSEIGYAGLWGIVVGIWVLQLTISPLWLRRFRQGPLEALWRKITYAGQSRPTPVATTEGVPS